MSQYRPERLWPRLVPAESVMVSIFGPGQKAWGLIANVSLAGACIVSGVEFRPGTEVLLRIGFDPDDPFTSQAKIVWTRDESESNKKPTFVHGVKFLLVEEDQRRELKDILSRPGFVTPRIPGAPSVEGGGLDGMLVDLNDDLDELGARIRAKLDSS